MINRILVPIDGSAHSKKALDFACELAAKFDAELNLLNVGEARPAEQTMVMGSSHFTVPLDHTEAIDAGRTITDAATEIVENKGLLVTNADVVIGSAANKILETVETSDIDTIVMGSRGLSDLKGLLLGSVSHKVGHLAKCTCISVR